MSEWRECKLGEVADVQTGPFGSQLHQSDYKAVGTPIITVEHLGDNRIVHSNIPLVGDLDKQRLIKYTLKKGDVVFSRVGSVDRCAYVHNEENGWMFSGRLLRVRAQDNLVDSRFLSFYFSQESFKDTIRMIAVGATMPSINTGILSNVGIILPKLSEQRAIAGVLSSLDDKIDLLHRQNKTLEGMAETLWRKMFVEDADTGWEIGKLGDISENIKNNVSTNNLRDHAHYVGLEHMERKHFALYNWTDTMSLESNKSHFRRRDILFGKLRAYFHKVCFAPVDGVCSTDILVIRPKSSIYFPLCLMWYSDEDVVNYADSASGGTRMPRTDWKTLAGYEIPIPTEKRVVDFNKYALPIIEKVEHNIAALRTLRITRDTLLPKLMSGEVRVKI